MAKKTDLGNPLFPTFQKGYPVHCETVEVALDEEKLAAPPVAPVTFDETKLAAPPVAPVTFDNTLPWVVIDGPNVACELGSRESPKPLGIQLALEYFFRCGCNCIALLPAHWVRSKPDQTAIVEDLIARNMIYLCPSGSYDDNFILSFAREKCGYVVSNDRYRDTCFEEEWIKQTTIRFSFIANVFVADVGAPAMKFILKHAERGDVMDV